MPNVAKLAKGKLADKIARNTFYNKSAAEDSVALLFHL